MNLKACLFDLDGVIVDTARFHYLSWKKLGEDIGISLTEEDNELLKGKSRTDSLDILLNLNNKTATQAEKDLYCAEKNEMFLSYVNNMTEADILPGVVAFLDDLKKNNIKIALGSSSKNAQTILQKINLIDYFEVIIDGTKIEKAKPHPEVFTKGADGFQLSYECCLVFEDAEAGIEAAHNAGMKAVGVGSPEILKEADYCIENMIGLQIETLRKL